MATKYELITERYLNTAGEIAKPEVWPSFLTTACHNFRLSFDKQVLLYTQRPDATAVLPIEGKHGWNQKFGRWVNRGSKGIALFDSDRNGVATLKYYFDISDTHEGRYPRPVPIWSVRPEFEQDILETLENSFGDLEKKDSLASGLIAAAQNVVEDNISDYLEQLMYYREGSFLEPLDDESIAAIFKPLLQNSVGYMLLVRCGIDPGAYYQKDDFGYISGFNTLQTINTLGTATSDISQMVLSEIARTTLSLQRQTEKQNRTFEDTARKEYAVPKKETTQQERSIDHDSDHLQQTGRLSSSQPSPAPATESSPWEVRIDAQPVSEGESENHIHESDDQRQAEPAPAGDRGNRQDEDRAKDVATAQAHPKSAENFVGMEIYGTYHSEKEAAGRAIINACTDLQGSESVQLGQYRGFSLSLQYDAVHTDYKLTIKGAMSHTISLGADIYGNITRMDNVVDGLAKELEAYQAVLQDTQTQLANAKAEMETPFAREKELAEKSARLKELNILLNMDQKDRSVLDDGPAEESPEKEKQREQER